MFEYNDIKYCNNVRGIDKFDSYLEDEFILETNDGRVFKINLELKLLIENIIASYDLERIKNIQGDIVEQFFVDYLLKEKIFIEEELYKKNLLIKKKRLKFHFIGFRYDLLYCVKFSWLKYLEKLLESKYIIINVIIVIALTIAYKIQWSDKVLELLEYGNLLYPALLILTFLSHEMGHVVSCTKHKVNIDSVGIGSNFIFPFIYIKINQLWKMDHKVRVIVNFAGVYFQIIFCNVLLLLNFFFLSKEVVLILMINCSLITLNLMPFRRFDGYWILMDILKTTSIKKYIYRIIEDPKKYIKSERYGIFIIGILMIYLVFNIYFIANMTVYISNVKILVYNAYWNIINNKNLGISFYKITTLFLFISLGVVSILKEVQKFIKKVSGKYGKNGYICKK